MTHRRLQGAVIGALFLLLAPAVRGQSPRRFERYFDLYYTVGYRFLDVDGSRDRFDTDFNLDEGFRASEIRIDAHFENDTGLPDVIRIESYNLADPYERHRITFDKPGLYDAAAGFHRSRYKYRASGDYHRVDRKEQVATYDLTVPLDDLEVFASFARSHYEGFWLTNRIGNRNLTPLSTIPDVASPRYLREDDAELGATLHVGRTTVTLVAEYLDQNEDNRWSYTRPAVANPAFPESESFGSGSSMEGPGGRLAIAHRQGPLDLSLQSRWLDRRRRIVGAGTGAGYDLAAFNATTASLSEGAARTFLTDGRLTYEFADDLVAHVDLRYLDHREHLYIRQTDVTVYPSLSTTLVVDRNLNQRTVSRLREASAELDWQPHASLTLTGGWGWSQEKLQVPDLDPSDADFARGTVVENGFLVGAQWRPDAHWSARVRYRDFGQGGLQLHDVVDHHTRGVKGNLGYRRDRGWWDLGVVHNRSQNPVSDARTAHTAYTVAGGYAPGEHLDLHGSYTLSDIDSRSRSTFYFDPSPTPVATMVGFRGESHVFAAGLDWRISERFHASGHAAYTTVHGDFELDMYHWALDLARLLENGRIGIRVEQMDYHEAGDPDDYDALVTYLYFSAAIRGHRPVAQSNQ